MNFKWIELFANGFQISMCVAWIWMIWRMDRAKQLEMEENVKRHIAKLEENAYDHHIAVAAEAWYDDKKDSKEMLRKAIELKRQKVVALQEGDVILNTKFLSR